VIIVRALYGLKSAGVSFQSFLVLTLYDMGLAPSQTDSYVWILPAMKPNNFRYYEYILVYVDDISVISHDPTSIMNHIKNDKFEPSSTYLCAKLKIRNLNGKPCWTISSYDYIHSAIKNVQQHLSKSNRKLPRLAPTPASYNYCLELDTSPELDATGVQYFQELIGVLRWAIELGRVDIFHELSILSSYQCNPRQDHMEQLYHILGFLQHNAKLTLYMDPEPPTLDPSMFIFNIDPFKEHYRDSHEELPFRMPEPLGNPVTTTAYVDASHAANKVTRRSYTGFILFVMKSLII